MDYVNCSLCGKDNFDYYTVSTKRNYPGTIKVRCKECGLLYTNPRMTKAELSDFYANYYDKGAMSAIDMKADVLKARDGNLEEIIDMDFYEENVLKYKRSGRYLEIGAGLGFQAWIATRLGFEEVHCTELDADAAEFGREHFGLENYNVGDLIELELPSDHFDFINCWHCIEHVQDMDEFLDEVKRILAPGGVFYFATPNLGSKLWDAYRIAKFATLKIPQIFDGIEHTYGLSPKTGRALLEAKGFDVLNVRGFGRSLRKCAPPDLGVTTLWQDIWHSLRTGRKFGRIANHFFDTKLSCHATKPVVSLKQVKPAERQLESQFSA